MKTIKDWQRAAYKLAVEKGFHSRECTSCVEGRHTRPVPDASGTFCDYPLSCEQCNGTGRVPIDPHSPTRIAACLAAVHSEISEAYECVARGGMELVWETSGGTQWPAGAGCATDAEMIARGFKPEGFPIELADVFLRLCDLAESLGLELENHAVSARLSAPCGRTPEELAAALCLLHDALPYTYEASDEKNEAGLNDALGTLQWIAVSIGVDLLACAELKHEFNRTRPVRHGGKTL